MRGEEKLRIGLDQIMKTLFLILFFITFSVRAEELKVLTWNVFMLPKPIYFSYQKERSDYIIDELLRSDYDLIFLQEAFTGGLHKKLRNRTGKVYGHQYYLKRKFISPTVFGSGVYVLSKYPLTSVQKVYYRACSGADCFASKGALLAEVLLPSGKEIQFVATHLQAGRSDKKRKVRMKQVVRLSDFLAKHSKQDVPQVLLGDINIDGKHDDFTDALERLNMISHPLEGELDYTSGFPIECYKDGSSKTKWVDHILVEKMAPIQVSEKRVKVFKGILDGKECPLSDHHAVEATLSI